MFVPQDQKSLCCPRSVLVKQDRNKNQGQGCTYITDQAKTHETFSFRESIYVIAKEQAYNEAQCRSMIGRQRWLTSDRYYEHTVPQHALWHCESKFHVHRVGLPIECYSG
jgi:hypothetical protein